MAVPSASIIILTYNNLDYTRQCVESILDHTHEVAYELILVDNASSDDTPEYLRELAETYENVQILLNQENEGFARGNNLGAGMAQGEYLVFLNNDTLVTRGWLSGLLKALADPQVGMAGPVTNSSGNESRISVDYDNSEGLQDFARKNAEAQRGKFFEISMLALLCAAMRRSVFEEIGPLDERFGLGMFEDDDYALRIKAKGYKILCVEDVFIHHWGSASFSRMDAGEFWALFQRNLTLFEEKWGIRWLPHPNRLEFIPEQLRQLIDGLITFSAKSSDYQQKLVALQQMVEQRDQAIVEKDKALAELWRRFQERDTFILRTLWRLGNILVPHGSRRERILTWLLRPLRAWRRYGSFGVLRILISRLAATPIMRGAGRLISRILPRSWKEYYQALRQARPIYDRSQVILYTDDASILPDYPKRQGLSHGAGIDQPVKVSLISTVRNEAANVESWLASLLEQSRLPDEIVICDGGSSDGTVEIIRKHAATFSIPIQVLVEAGANIAHGRNIAIQHASYEVIACTDFGCRLDKNWLENLILPFECDEKVDVSFGFSQIAPANQFSRMITRFFIPVINTVDPQQFIPSARNFAMRKPVWEQAGGYPEWLTFAGEDTLFTLNAKLQNRVWAFVPGAVVYWHAPRNLRLLYRTIYRYARGDGETGTFAYLYWVKIKELAWTCLKRAVSMILLVGIPLALGLWVHPWAGWGLAGVFLLLILGACYFKLLKTARREAVSIAGAWQLTCAQRLIDLAQPFGFAKGVANRPKVLKRQSQPYILQLQQILAEHPEHTGVIVYPPTHDWGFMFQRPHQMARAFARQGYVYFFCTQNEKTDSVIGFKQVEPRLYVCHVPWETFASLEKPIVYVGQPWRNRELRYFHQPRVIYDHFDEIEIFSADPADHQALLERAEVVLVTAQRLMEKVQTQRPDAIFTPNGVDFQYVQDARPAKDQAAPADLQAILAKGRPILGYSGALAEWFDYELLAQAAKARPDLEFVLIGVSYDGSLERSGLLSCGLKNVHWLGMKPYAELFKYTWRFSAGIIPFKINTITLSTTPVKLFEYMACELPVIATAMPEARKYAGVFIVEANGSTADNFIQQVDAALAARVDPAYQATIRQVASQNTWDSRVQAVIERLRQNAGA